jgi:hypothetical protein
VVRFFALKYLRSSLEIPAGRFNAISLWMEIGLFILTLYSRKEQVTIMKLLTQEIRKKLPPLYAQDGKGGKAMVYLKLFTPDSSFTWYITEGSPVKDDEGHVNDYAFFGLVDGHEKELGYFYLSELQSVRGSLGLPVERDLWWKPKTLAEIAPEKFMPGDRQGAS